MHSNLIQNPSRNVWLDALKIFSAFLVIFQHSVSHVWTSYPVDTIVWKLTHVCFLFSRAAVLLFFMCSGAGMLRKEHSISRIFRKNIFQLLKIYLAWMIIYGLADCISLFRENLATPRTCINAMIKNILFGHYHTWFILALIGLYFITPFLFQITRTPENIRYFLFISIIFTILLPCLRSFSFLERLTNTLDHFNMHFVYGYVLYFVTGYYISILPWKKRYTWIAAAVFIISFSFACIYSMNLSIAENLPRQEIFSEFTPLMFLTTISIFSIFRGLEHHLTSNKLIRTFIGYGYALYLMHPLFLEYFQKLSGLYAFAGALTLYFLCLLICFFISKSNFWSKLLLK